MRRRIKMLGILLQMFAIVIVGFVSLYIFSLITSKSIPFWVVLLLVVFAALFAAVRIISSLGYEIPSPQENFATAPPISVSQEEAEQNPPPDPIPVIVGIAISLVALLRKETRRLAIFLLIVTILVFLWSSGWFSGP